MKVLIDTNVLVSAALKDKTPETVILFVTEQPDCEWIVSDEILKEYKDVLARKKFGLPDALLKKWHDLLETLTTTVDVKVEVHFPRDEKDAKFLKCAISSDAAFFITGDKDFSDAVKLVNTIIISANSFKKRVCDAWA